VQGLKRNFVKEQTICAEIIFCGLS